MFASLLTIAIIIKTKPTTIKAKIVKTLTKANQNSNSPKSLTLVKLIIVININAKKAQTHPGTTLSETQ